MPIRFIAGMTLGRKEGIEITDSPTQTILSRKDSDSKTLRQFLDKIPVSTLMPALINLVSDIQALSDKEVEEIRDAIRDRKG